MKDRQILSRILVIVLYKISSVAVDLAYLQYQVWDEKNWPLHKIAQADQSMYKNWAEQKHDHRRWIKKMSTRAIKLLFGDQNVNYINQSNNYCNCGEQEWQALSN